MAAGSSAALICDTGALIDYLVESAPDHRLFRNAIDQARTRFVPGLVLAEVDYYLRDERRAMHLFMQALARGAFTYAPPTDGQLARAMEYWTGAAAVVTGTASHGMLLLNAVASVFGFRFSVLCSSFLICGSGFSFVPAVQPRTTNR